MESEEDAEEKYIVALSSCELIVGFLGNVTACMVILCSRSMHTLTNFYLLSLSVSDLLILIMGDFNDIYQYLDLMYKYDFTFDSEVLDCALTWVFETAVHASTLIVTVFTVERYLAICHPFIVQPMANSSRAKKIIAIVWLVAALLAILPVIIEFVCHTSFSRKAALSKTFTDIWPYMIYTRVVVCFALPMLLITVMYIMIGIKLYKSSNERQIITSQADRTSNTKVLKMFATVILIFFISWAPYYTTHLLYYIDQSNINDANSMFAKVGKVSRFTYLISPTLNPVIYVMMSKKFRESLKFLLSGFRMVPGRIRRTFTLRNTNTNETNLEIA